MEIMPEFIPRIFQLQTTMEKMLKFLPEHSFTKIILLRIHTIKNTSIFFKTRTTQKRVPGALRKSNEAIYTPQEVSIGPIHHGKKNLQHMKTQKRSYLKLFYNRLPFFILEKLYDHLLQDGEGNYTSFPNLAYEYLNRYNKSPYKPSVDNKEILHFTDLVRSSLSFNQRDPRSAEPIGKFYSATKLHEAAIHFKKSRNDQCLLDVTFTSTKGELRIPRLQIDDHTELLFGNLIALEWCHYKGEEYISHYVKLLETLVAKPKDVALLIKNNIIDTTRDGASVKNLIDKLSAETSEEYSIYYNLYKQLDTHYQNSWLKNSAYFREVYFGNLWKSTATVSATVLLLFTLVQTICSVISLR
nr:UPF0481 protein At3g47200-like [Populus alba]